MLKTLKRDRQGPAGGAQGATQTPPGRRSGRKEPEVWTPPPLPDHRLPDEPVVEASREAPLYAEGPAGQDWDDQPLGDEPPVIAERSDTDEAEDYQEAEVYEEEPSRVIPGTVGALLAETRCDFGQDIEEVCAALRIRPVFLRAIEESRHEDLPGLAYAVGFVRSYADYLGLDVDDCVSRFKEEAAGIDRTPNLSFPTPVPEAKVPTGAIILVSLVLAGLAYLAWTYVSRDDDPAALQTSEAVQAETAGDAAQVEAGTQGTASAQAPEQSAAAPSATQQASTTEAAQAPASAAPAATPTLDQSTASPAATLAASTSADPAGGSAAGASATGASTTGAVGQVVFTEAASSSQPAEVTGESATAAALPYDGPRVVIKATQDSWVQIRNASNASIFTRVLRAGDVYEVPDQSGLTLLTGNAGGLAITVDGEEIPKLGRSGQVRRNVSLNPDSLKAG